MKRIKRAALRLARYFRNLGHRVKIRQHKSGAGVYYTVEFLATKTPVLGSNEQIFGVKEQILGRDQSSVSRPPA